MSKSFWREIVDVPKYERFVAYGVGAIIFLILFWVFTALPEYKNESMVYLIMMIIWIFGLSFDLVWHSIGKPDQAAVNGVGKKPWTALFFGVLGGLGLVFMFSFQSMFQPFSIISNAPLAFLFVVVAAPFVEANFFRGVLQPTFTLLINDWFVKNEALAAVLAMVLVSFAFAVFHVNVFGLSNLFNVWIYVPYFLFGLIVTLGMYYFESVAFEYGVHGVNNLFAFLRGFL